MNDVQSRLDNNGDYYKPIKTKDALDDNYLKFES